ncbi:MAG: hypothetical protein ACTH14_08995, partial [Jeotgalicoccus sp.]
MEFVHQLNNVAHIYERSGFEVEDTLKEQFYTKGEYQDAYLMGLLKRNWIRDNQAAHSGCFLFG